MVEQRSYRYVFGLLCLSLFVFFQTVHAEPAAVSVTSYAGLIQAPAAVSPAAQPREVVDAGAATLASDVDAALHKEGSDVDSAINGFFTNEVEPYLPEKVTQVMHNEIFGISMWQLSCSFLLLLLTLVLRNIILKVVLEYFARFLKRTPFQFDDKLLEALRQPLSVFLLLFGVFVSLMILPMSDGLREFIQNFYRGLIMVIFVWCLIRAVDVLVDALAARNNRLNGMQGFVPLIRKTLKIFIFAVGLVMIIDNMGFNVGGILATLGIGGAAIAFASKDTVANGFGTLMIMLDRPFKVGDWIMVGNKVDGDVEEIGLRSTKVRTWPKTIISIPNGVLANEYINNWSRMPKRRVRQVLNIAYGATANDMEGLVEDIRQILRGDQGVDQDFMLVNFTDLTSESMEILVYYFTISIKWLEHMDVRQRINLNMMRAIEERGLKIAFLEQSLELEYNKDLAKDEEVPWDKRWSDESKNNPKGNYTRRQSASDKVASLPGDFGPTQPM